MARSSPLVVVGISEASQLLLLKKTCFLMAWQPFICNYKVSFFSTKSSMTFPVVDRSILSVLSG